MKKAIVSIFVCMLLIASAVPSVVGSLRKASSDEVVIWDQPPDVTGNGIDVRCDRNDGVNRTLANDFRCTVTGPIIRVHLFGSWKYNEVGTMTKIHLSIHEDIPVDESPTEYSMPGDLLWAEDFFEFEINNYTSEWEWWWDPYTGVLIEDCDSVIWEYIISIDEEIAFPQEGTPDEPIIYWLDVWVESEGGEFGWKTADEQHIDDAVYYIDDDPFWFELIHPVEEYSLDCACMIIGKAVPEPPDIVVVVDDVIDILRFDVVLRNNATVTYHGIPWTMKISGGLFWPSSPATFNGNISSIQPNQEVPISSEYLIGLGSIEIIITVNGCEPVTLEGYILLFIILCFK